MRCIFVDPHKELSEKERTFRARCCVDVNLNIPSCKTLFFSSITKAKEDFHQEVTTCGF